jgi:hypothetical protein
MVVILWKEDTKLVGRTTPFGMVLGLSANPSKLDSVRSNVLQRLPAWFVKEVIVFCILGTQTASQ